MQNHVVFEGPALRGWRFLSRITAIGRQNRRSTPGALRETFDFGLAHARCAPPPPPTSSTTSSIATVATATACTMSNAIEDPRVRAAIEHYLLDLENTQPKNTKRNYRPKQEEWKASRMRALQSSSNWPAIPDVWPASVPQGQQLPGDLVDEGKLLLFMKEKGKRVADERKRHLEAQEAKRAVKDAEHHQPAHHTNTQLPPADTIVVGGGGSEYESDSDLELYESTLKLQYNTVRGYVSAIQKLYDEQKSRGVNPAARPYILATTWSRKRKEYMDRGVGTLRDVYAPAQIPDHTNVAWSEREIACALRTQVDFLLGNHMLLRWQTAFPDLPNEGFKAQGIPQRRWLPTSTAAWSMDLLCGIEIRDLVSSAPSRRKGGKVSVFQRSEDWYETKVLRRSAKEPQGKRDGIHRNPITQRVHRPFHSPNIQLQWTSRFYKKAGIKVSKVSHAPRVAATQNADMAGASRQPLAWADLNYTDPPSRSAVADFDPEWPPVVLLVQVWPQLDKWKELEQNMAAGAFLELLEWLREVLLQDAVFLRESYPDHPIFQDPVFSCPEFEAQPYHGHSKAIPVVAEKLRTVLTQQTFGASSDLCTKLDEFAQATYTVLQVNMRRSRELINRGAALHERRSSEQQQGMVQAGQPPGRAHGEPPGPREPPSFKLPELLRLWRQGWGEMPSVDSLERDWEKNYFSTRKIIVDEVRRRAQSDGLTEDILLDKLFKAIRKDRQGEKGHKRASGQFNVGGSEKSMAQMTRTLAAKVPPGLSGSGL
ncbi:centromere DNA-binding protein complex CBF3 subunit, domain 2 domain-containing protein [Hirsutella rhossiliensis]